MLYVDGVNQIITVPHHDSLSLGASWTLNFIIKFNALGSFPAIIEKVNSYSIYSHSGGTLYVDFFGGGYVGVSYGYAVGVEVTTGIIKTGTDVKFYKNGVHVFTQTLGSNPTPNVAAVTLFDNEYSTPANCWARNITLHNGRALSDAEMRNFHFSGGRIAPPGNLVGRWLLNDKSDGEASDNSAGEIKDLSPYGNHGQCSNSPVFYAAASKLTGVRRAA